MEVIVLSGITSVVSALVVGAIKEHELKEERHKRRVAELEKERETNSKAFYEERANSWLDDYLKQKTRCNELLHKIDAEKERAEELADKVERLTAENKLLCDLIQQPAAPARTSESELNCCSCRHFGGWHDEDLFYCKLHGEYYIKPNSICRQFTPAEGATV